MNATISATTSPVVNAVSDAGLRDALWSALRAAEAELAQVEACFQRFAEQDWPAEQRRLFMKSWHHTHLKMLPIYGLSCRLHKRALEAGGEAREHYFMAAALNAETSYEDLAVETPEWRTHSELFDELADAVCGGDEWKLGRYCLPEAEAFRGWLYHNMVMGDIEAGLLSNLFSEIYNHGEYSFALGPFLHLMHSHRGLSEQRARELALYIDCHVMGEVEADHFNCVLRAIEHYHAASGRSWDYAAAERLFTEYLRRVARVFVALSAQLSPA